MAHTFDWLKPSATWQSGVLDYRSQSFFTPQLLEFHSDTFMQDFFAAAASVRPDALTALIAKPPVAGSPLKLFQPIHGNFYLVCASLCCRLPGFPDREIDTGAGESLFFVLRKWDSSGEYAWIDGEKAKGWTAVNGRARSVVPDEQRFPLMTAGAGNGRPLHFGYISVASRKTYAVPASTLADLGGRQARDIRIEELDSRFTNRLDALKNVKPAAPLAVWVYLILDLWDFLEQYVPDVAGGLRSSANPSFSDPAKNALIGFLAGQPLKGTLTLAGALHHVAQQSDQLNQLTDSGTTLDQDVAALGFDANYNLSSGAATVDADGLLSAVGKVLPATAPTITLPKVDPSAGSTYVLRCVYERPQCEPAVQIVSQPSALFQLAPVYDPDAPVRPVRIPLPADVSISGLRKFKKGVTFMLSDSMKQKMEGVQGNTKSFFTDSPQLSDSSGGIAMMCSFSIQIIFIVAFMLLIMFVIILNFAFWWMAFFRICLPIPKRLLPG